MLNLEQRLKRDQDIIKDYQAGMAVVRMVAKHRIDSQQIYEILKQNGIKRNRYNRPAANKQKPTLTMEQGAQEAGFDGLDILGDTPEDYRP